MIYKGKEIKSKYKYIEFVLDEAFTDPKKKTIVISIQNNSSEDELSWIEWYVPWRQYCSNTISNIVFNSQCHKDIAEFLDNLNKIHREVKT